MWVWAKTCIVWAKTEFNFIATVIDTLNNYPSPVYQVLNVNLSAFLKGILQTLQSYRWNNGTHGGHQLGNVDLGLLSLNMWSTCVSFTTVWVSWLLMGCPKQGFFPPPALPNPPIPHQLTSPPIPPTPSISNTDGRKGWQKIPLSSAISDREG